MKRFYPFSLVALFLALLAGYGINQVTANDRTNDQNLQVLKTAKVDSETNLKQRTGVPFRVKQSTQKTLPLLAIMSNLEQNMAALQGGIWRGNYQVIHKAAKALANHAKIPKGEIRKIRTILGKKGLKNFVAADKRWHNKALELVRAAKEKKMAEVVNLTTKTLQRCASCHTKYRETLRDDPRWLQR